MAEFFEREEKYGHRPAEEQRVEDADEEVLEEQRRHKLHGGVGGVGFAGCRIKGQQDQEPERQQADANSQAGKHVRVRWVRFLPDKAATRGFGSHLPRQGRLRHVRGDLKAEVARGASDELARMLGFAAQLHLTVWTKKFHG